ACLDGTRASGGGAKPKGPGPLGSAPARASQILTYHSGRPVQGRAKGRAIAGKRSVSRVTRAGAVAALVLGAAVVAGTLLGGRRHYAVHAVFEDAAQLVKGDPVSIGGRAVGSV